MGKRNEQGIMPGTADLLILKALSDGPAHGFGISRALRERSEGVVDLQDAALYQALHRMARQGWVEAEWGISDRGRRAKFYHLTAQGVKRLVREESDFRAYVEGVFRVLAFNGAADQ